MTTISIFTNEAEAVVYSDKIHNYLTANRPGYNAIKWCDPVQSADELEWFIKQPIEEIEDKWAVAIDSSNELENAKITKPLPDIGELVTIDEYYLYNVDIVKCRQTHNRTEWEPKDTPALFAFFRYNSDQLQWIENEQVEVGWIRIYNGVKYEVIQSHQTQSDWTPDNTPTLWKVWVGADADPDISEWVQPNSTNPYMKGDKVLFNGSTYESTIDNNVWSPLVYGWVKI